MDYQGGENLMSSEKIVLSNLPSDYIRGIDYACKLFNMSREFFITGCIEIMLFGTAYAITYEDDEYPDGVWGAIEVLGLKPIEYNDAT